MEIKEDNQTLAFKKLDELRERLYFEGSATRDFKILLIAQELGEIEKMILEEKKTYTTISKEKPRGGYVAHKVEDLDKGHEDTLHIR